MKIVEYLLKGYRLESIQRHLSDSKVELGQTVHTSMITSRGTPGIASRLPRRPLSFCLPFRCRTRDSSGRFLGGIVLLISE